ncbi:phosphodiester glycosidase family protein [Sphingomonas sp. TX0522]|jgi:hypothetical protein|uniref:phosphodiester glycosidase family protein n=1 Tax=Sphingomonas sp. TX0522 TaxID=2479205 RepID=UPI0018E056DB|nr:phosphodiester glycosidase family protein [Sphingomonas sp. TX0522]
MIIFRDRRVRGMQSPAGGGRPEMSSRHLILSIALVTSGAVAQTPQPAVTQVKPPGRPQVTYAYTLIDPRRAALSVKGFDQPTQVGAVPAKLSCGGVAITGGFSRRSGNGLKPEGLIRTDRGQLSGLANWKDGGVLWAAGDEVRIIRIAAWKSSSNAAGQALQTRPLLVFDGRVDEPLNDKRRWNRVAVGTMRDGRVVLIGAFTARNDAVTLREFAQDAIAILGPNLASLLNMDGGPSAFLLSRDVRLLPAPGVVTTYVCAEGR